ncbi:MAG TPA: hypothetical protein VHY37_08655 [Tepidisphaeraceae bacterium]|nr:hypothetical protein [Tepidisphaeraceae bacterium]
MRRRHLIAAATMSIGAAALIGCSTIPPVPTGGQSATPTPAEPIDQTAHPGPYGQSGPTTNNANAAVPGNGNVNPSSGGYNNTGVNNPP